MSTRPCRSLDMRSRDIFRHDRRFLSRGRRAGRLAQPVAHAAARRCRRRPIRNVMSDLEHLGLVYAPHISAGRLPTQRGPALLRRRLHGARRPLRRGAPRHRGAGHGLRQRRIAGAHADRGQPDAVRACRAAPAWCSPPRTRWRSSTSSSSSSSRRKALAVLVVAERRRREPHRRPAGRHHRLAAARGLELPQRPYPRPHAGRGQGRYRTLKEETKAALDTLSQELVEKGLAVWAGAEGGLPARLIVRGRANLLENVTAQADIELLKHLFEDLENAGRADPAARPRRAGLGRAHLHRLGEQAVLAVRLVAGGGALPRQGRRASSARSA